MEENFKSAFDYKVIYVFEVADEKHKGKVKIGDATLHTSSNIDVLTQNCRELNQAALERIKEYSSMSVMKKLINYLEEA